LGAEQLVAPVVRRKKQVSGKKWVWEEAGLAEERIWRRSGWQGWGPGVRQGREGGVRPRGEVSSTFDKAV